VTEPLPQEAEPVHPAPWPAYDQGGDLTPGQQLIMAAPLPTQIALCAFCQEPVADHTPGNALDCLADIQAAQTARFTAGGLLPGTATGVAGLVTPDPYQAAANRWEAARVTNEPIGEVARDVWATIPNHCFIRGCSNTDVDPRGPIATRDGRLWKACVPHWEGVNAELGRQVEADRRERDWATDYDASTGPDLGRSIDVDRLLLLDDPADTITPA
jgi:hypothetical protein